MLEINGLSRSFGTKTALAGVSLQIDKGSFVGVIGRSGAGKSTLLRLINRLVEPSAGRIVFDGVDVTALRGRPSHRHLAEIKWLTSTADPSAQHDETGFAPPQHSISRLVDEPTPGNFQFGKRRFGKDCQPLLSRVATGSGPFGDSLRLHDRNGVKRPIVTLW